MTRRALLGLRSPLLAISASLQRSSRGSCGLERSDPFYLPTTTEIFGAAWSLWRDPDFL